MSLLFSSMIWSSIMLNSHILMRLMQHKQDDIFREFKRLKNFRKIEYVKRALINYTYQNGYLPMPIDEEGNKLAIKINPGAADQQKPLIGYLPVDDLHLSHDATMKGMVYIVNSAFLPREGYTHLPIYFAQWHFNHKDSVYLDQGRGSMRSDKHGVNQPRKEQYSSVDWLRIYLNSELLEGDLAAEAKKIFICSGLSHHVEKQYAAKRYSVVGSIIRGEISENSIIQDN